jgi:aminobenzoyl-glutamate utilization protein B
MPKTASSRSPAMSAYVDAIAGEIIAIADAVWKHAEPAFKETKSVKLMKDAIGKHGFRITKDSIGELDTAFVAEYGKGKPVIGILAEYDALPGLGNAAQSARAPGPTGTATGHACGHNLIGAGAWGAAVAVRDWMEKSKAPGTVRLYGCPAEEGGSGKMWMAQEGVFDDLDAALHWHPIERSAVANVRTTATTRFTVKFQGTSAHAGVSPWLGRSALHAVELFVHGVNVMREHLLPTARTHYVIDEGGLSPNVVTDKASVRILMRDATSESVLKTAEWVRDIAKGAALATQTKVTLTQVPGTHNVEPNGPLAQRAQQVLEAVGAPSFTKDEHEFAKKLQAAFGVPEKGLNETVAPLPPEPALGGSSDVGDVSKNVPTMGYMFPAIPIGLSLHTWGATACTGMGIGHKAALQAAKALAGLAAEVLTDALLRKAAKDDFTKRLGGRKYEPIAPKGKGVKDFYPVVDTKGPGDELVE